MRKIVIIGASGLGNEIKDLIDSINRVSHSWNIIGFYDDARKKNEIIIDNLKCLGCINDLKKIKEELSVVFAIANRRDVQNIYNSLKSNNNILYPNIIDPTVIIRSRNSMGKGNVIALNSHFSCDIEIGDFNFFNGLVGIGHDVEIESFNCFMPRVQISGNVSIGNSNFFGMNSSVVQGKQVGDNNIINAYSLLTKNIKNERKYFGIPARRIDV